VQKIGLFAVFSLIVLMIIPVYADVDKAEIDKATFEIDENFTISGTTSDANRVMLVASMKGPSGEKLTKNIRTDPGTFSFIPIDAKLLFKSKGEYTIRVFTEFQNVANATVIKLFYDNGVISLVPDYVLELKEIGNKQVVETEKLSFTASVTDSSIEEIEYRLEKQPSGATIHKDTGAFSWTPTTLQVGGYVFDIIVKSGPVEDKETIVVTVSDKPEQAQPTPEPEPKELGIASFVDESKDPQSYVDRYNSEASYKKWFDDNYSKYDSIYQAVGLDEPQKLASFVDESKDPQSYVDRYNSEASYKKWFDDNYSEYDSIYQAVGLEEPVVEEPKELAAFVDPNLDPQYYIDRYNKEITYKNWFDKTYPDITIYDAVGVEEPEIEEEEFGECGEGTDLVDGMCVIVEQRRGGCLIATATYGSEMAPQVQLLREIRDNQLMNTDSGMSFMTGFNQLYYSFSPTIADFERESPAFKEAVKLGITPLLSSLSIMEYAESDSEVLGYGIGVILLNLGMYIAVPAIVILKARKYIRI
jgi:hypothetical protein